MRRRQRAKLERIYLRTIVDAEAIHAGGDLVALMHFRVLRGQRVEEGAVAAAEVADADRAVAVADHFEVAAGEELVGHAHVAFAADDETVRRDLELLPFQRAFDTYQHRARRRGR